MPPWKQHATLPRMLFASLAMFSQGQVLKWPQIEPISYCHLHAHTRQRQSRCETLKLWLSEPLPANWLGQAGSGLITWASDRFTITLIEYWPFLLMLMQESVTAVFSVVLGLSTEALNNQKYTKRLQWQYTYTNNHTSIRFTHIVHIAFIFLQSNLNDSINWEAISGVHFMASQTAQPGAYYGKGMCVLMSISCHPPHTHTHTLTQSSPPQGQLAWRKQEWTND